MAAGRLSGYSDNNRNRNGDRDYERSWNGDRAREVGDQVNPGRSRVRQNSSRSDSRSSSGSACHGHKRNENVGALNRELGELSSESGSDGATESDGLVTEGDVNNVGNRDKQFPIMASKRKFSPIVWDGDKENASRNVKTRKSPVTSSLPLPSTQFPKRRSPYSDLDKGVEISSGRDSKTTKPFLGKVNVSTESESPRGESTGRNVKTGISPVTGSLRLPTTQSSELRSQHPDFDKGVEFSHGRGRTTTGPSLGEVDVLPGPHVSTGLESPTGEYPLLPMEEAGKELAEEVCPDNNQETVSVDDDEYVSTRTINASRWANDAESPADEGEMFEYKSIPKLKNKRHVAESSEKMGIRKSITPEFGEPKREGSGVNKERLSDRHDRRNGCANDLDMNGSMEIDMDHNYGATSFSISGSESVDEHDSQGTQEPPTRNVNTLQGCRSVDEFDRLNKIDEGTYGVVFRAMDKKTREIVALKKVKMEKEREGFPLTSLREMNILLSFHHPSIVDVKEVVVGSNLDSIFMVMEYMEHDLKGLMETMKQPFSQSEVKCLMLQLLEGVKYLHDNWVLHRDLKTSNVLLNNRGELKICDFGLARQYGSPLKPYTHLVVTLWYRAPELLLGSKQYSTAIDMWSLGCIMAELLSKEPLFNGKTEFDQLHKIFKTLGMPTETIWPGFSKLPGVKGNFVKHQYNLLRKKFPATSFTGSPVLSDKGFDLLNRLLTYDPAKRINAEDALNHAWFREVPLPKSKEFMPTFPAQHAQNRRMRRVMKSPDPLEEQRLKELQQGELGTGGLFGQGM